MAITHSTSNNITKGKKGEDIAVDFLRENGYKILWRNYRYGRSEIDVICEKNATLIFVEVKLRTSNAFGFPEQAVNSKKEKLIRTAAEGYIYRYDWQKDIRFDIISIEVTQPEKYFITHFEDVFT